MIGETTDAWTVKKYRNTTAETVVPYLAVQEVRGIRYHSYITTVEQEGAGLVVTDLLRKGGYIFYSLYFTEVRIPLEDGGSGAGGGDRGVKGRGRRDSL
jgi:hypothetical protein